MPARVCLVTVMLPALTWTCRAAPKAAVTPPDKIVSHAVASAPASTEPPAMCPQHLPRFQDYRADSIYHGTPHWPTISLGPDSENMDHTMERAIADAKGGLPTFAGYLAVVQSGCGSPCQMQQLVDVRSGKVVASFNTSLGEALRLDSRLLIANPMDSTQCFDTAAAYGRPVYYVWNGAGLDSIW